MSEALAPAGIQWNDILKALRNRQCILFLGPDLLPGLNLYTELCRFLGGATPALPPDVEACYPNEELFLFAHPGARMNVCFRLDDFYAAWQERFGPLFARIAALPIPLVVSTLPDDGLHKAFDAAGVPHQFHAYNFRGNAAAGIKSPRQNRLIFNLFGNCSDANSLILDHDDLFGFLSQFMGARKLSDTHIEIQEMLGSGSTIFLFLGFQFDKWYMQILLHLLNPGRFKARQYALNSAGAQETRVFFAKKFQVEFVDDLNPQAFLTELCARWEADDATPKPADVTRQNLRDWLKNAETERVLQELEKIFTQKNDADGLHETAMLSARHSKLELAVLKGTVSKSDEQLEFNRIHDALLNLLNQIPE